MQRVLSVVLAAWAGSLWAICGIVAPSLFTVISDRQLAGQTAGHFFRVAAWLGLALGAIALVLLTRGTTVRPKPFDYGLLITTMLGPLTSELVLRSMMSAARAAEDMSRFGTLHGVSALLYGVACVTALLLVWRLSSVSNR